MDANETTFLKRFTEDKKGNVAITFGLMATVMLCSVGAAVDYSRSVHAESKLQKAADAAATAGAAAIGATPAQKMQIATQYFQQNNAGSFGNNASISVNVDGNNVSVTASSTVPAGITQLMGVENIPIEAKAEAGSSGRKLELAMMIDVTGSMGATRGGMSKVAALKLAADDLLDILFPNGATSSGQVKVAIAPMADYVNAGPYASAVTGLPSTGAYANLTNLRNTKNGPFSGNHSGSYGTTPPTGSQAGATPSNGVVQPGQIPGATAGGTYSSAHCTAPGALGGGSAQMLYSNTGKPMGYWIDDPSSNPPSELKNAADTSGFYRINKFDEVDGRWEYGTSLPSFRSSGYYIPIPANITGIQYEQRNGPSWNDTYNIGVPIEIRSAWGVSPPNQIKYGRYWRIIGWSSSSGFQYDSDWDEGFYLPVPETGQVGGGGGTDPNCTGTNAAPDQPAGQLISCVTERTTSDRYTDASPGTGNYVGPYNQVAPGRSTNKLNYSQDGKCYTAGRELPAVIPLTGDRTKLDAFFAIPDNNLIGGATPGHLGHAWAWYMLSPEWNDVWPLNAAVPYNDPITKKYAIIMTDGEYNTQYASATSVTQAKALCEGMKAKNIHVMTIGFGFTSDAEGTAAGQMLQECASDAGSFFWPYDSAELRQTFKDIGAKMLSGSVNLVVMK
jgi:Flp pilus assembly protein TadG